MWLCICKLVGFGVLCIAFEFHVKYVLVANSNDLLCVCVGGLSVILILKLQVMSVMVAEWSC